ncbi:aldehyde dehydrogenase family protein [Pseudonocardia sp. MH-G8]|uniref:aldehyde dehydrogenase family protein n=1 Tax=Pseudonocardia sp. MH-G8 TaxID=1854588 RepID=UPI000BA06048|nr:aldehyde dehydrogenase family protein [Pseudonocardia sp. MH-G8]OZM77136.1 aldehyde dehydrogenase [Pseudonocardia sp. MH-G8]
MAERLGMVIDGRRVTAADDRWLPVRNPSTGQVLAEVAAGSGPEIDMAVAAAAAEARDGAWSRFSPIERSKVLNRIADRIEDSIAEISELEARNNGRPVAETRAQIGTVPDFFRYNAALALSLRGETVPLGDGYFQYLHHVPIGVAAVMTPYNHPMLIAARGVAPALAAGNAVVLKPSELTPLTSLMLADLAFDAGLPPGALHVVNGNGPEAGAALVAHPGVARVEFTGGTETGRRIVTTVAERFARSTAELGGKSPVLVFEDSDLADAAAGIAFAGFVASGQSCIAGARIIVQRERVEELTARLVKIVDGIRLGDPLDRATQMGPVISAAARERILAHVDRAVGDGATVLTGGKAARMDGELSGGFFLEPTVLGGVTEDMAICQDEVFGPVVSIEAFDDEADAVRRANATQYGLGAAVWTRDVGRAHRVSQAVRAGMVWVNDHHRLSPAMPWGGFKDSGLGKQAGEESFRGFLDTQSVIIRTAPGAPQWFTTGDDRLN